MDGAAEVQPTPTPVESDDDSSGSDTSSEGEHLASVNSDITSLLIKLKSSAPQNEDYQKLSATMTRLLMKRFDLSQKATHLHEAITWSRDVVAASKSNARCSDGDRLEHLSLLENCLHKQYSFSGDKSHVDEAISAGLELVRSTPNGDPEKAKRLYDLAESFLYRHKLVLSDGGMINNSNINESISAFKQAVELASDKLPSKPIYLRKLAEALLLRFAQYFASDLDEAIRAQSQAVELLGCGHADRASYLIELSSSLRTRFTRTKDTNDLEKSISAQSEAVAIIPDEEAIKAGCLSDLGYLFSLRFRSMGDVGDIDRSISCRTRAIELSSDTDYNQPLRLSDLGIILVERFRSTGNIVDLDNAISFQTRATKLIPDRPVDRPLLFCALANTYFTRYRRLNNITDLNQAILFATQALEFTRPKHITKARHLSNLGILLRQRSERDKNVTATEDLDKAISYQTEAVELISRLTADRNPEKPGYLTNLGISLHRRFERSGNTDSDAINRAIECQTKAVKLTDNGRPEKTRYLSNLNNALLSRFELSKNIDDIQQATSVQRQALDLTPSEHASKPAYLYGLGCALESRFLHLGNVADATEAVNAFRESAESHRGSPLIRFKAACSWARLCVRQGQMSLVAWKTAIDLIPQFVWLGTEVTERYDAVISVGKVVHEAVAFSIQLGEYGVAAEWMEQGRCIVWDQILRLRTPLDDFAVAHPDIARELKEVSLQLEAAGIGSRFEPLTDVSKLTKEESLEEDAQKHRRLADRYEALLKEARQIPGFEHFLKPKPLYDLLQGCTANSPVVMLNLDETRCDALVLRDHSLPIVQISLDQFDLKKAMKLRSNLLDVLFQHDIRMRGPELSSRGSRAYDPNRGKSMQDILGTLWKDIVQPVLSRLSKIWLNGPPHITWCATGPLVFLPLHAAGIYDSSDKSSKCFHHTVSSYTPSLTILAEAAKRAASSDQHASPRILAISQPKTPNHNPLPGTFSEVKEIQDHLLHTQGEGHESHDFKWLNGENATIDAVLTEMSTHSWCHFACHGIQNLENPTNSAFALHDGHLQLRTIMSKSFTSAQVAFLSACQTATGDEKRPEEAIHHVAGMLAAGYCTVFGTMWSIGDYDAPLVAKEVYSYLLSKDSSLPEGGDHRYRGAYALHNAVECLRKNGREDDFLKWVPFVHFGV